MKEDVLKSGISRQLPVPLTKAQRDETLQELADRHAQLKLIAVQRKEAIKRFKRQADECVEDMERCAEELETKTRISEVYCYERCVGDKAELVRTDTGEVVDRRPLKPEEKQRELIDQFIDEVAAHEKTWAEDADKPKPTAKRKGRAKAAT